MLNVDGSAKRPRVDDQTPPPAVKKVQAGDVLSKPAQGRVKGLDALTFYPVTILADFLTPTKKFKPIYTHQFFGSREEILGFGHLSIDVFYITDTLDLFVRTEGALWTVAPSTKDVANANSEQTEQALIHSRVLSYLNKIPYPGTIHASEQSFIQAIEAPNRGIFFVPLGQRLPLFDRYPSSPIALEYATFEISADHLSDISANYHRRLEWFLHFYIDACSKIEYDANWSICFMYRLRKVKVSEMSPTELKHYTVCKQTVPQCPSPEDRKEVLTYYESTGILTMYNYFSIPLNRCRISQIFMFPLYQGQFLGFHTLLYVYQRVAADDAMGEITVEDPATSFAQLRDCVGLARITEEGILPMPVLMGATPQSAEPQPFATGESFSQELRLRLKESKYQIKRLVELTTLVRMLPEDLSDLRFGPVTELDLSSVILPEFVTITEQAREWRSKPRAEPKSAPPVLSEFHKLPELKQFRIDVKKRLYAQNFEFIQHLSVEEQRLVLWKLWETTFHAYCRTIMKVRTFFLQH